MPICFQIWPRFSFKKQQRRPVDKNDGSAVKQGLKRGEDTTGRVQMLRIYSGNATSQEFYKTLVFPESALISELLSFSLKKFNIIDNESLYKMTVVHCETGGRMTLLTPLSC